jgi:hypothetical protein
MTWGRIDRSTPAASIRSDEQMAKAVLGAELMES